MQRDGSAIQDDSARNQARTIDADFWRTLLERRSIRRYTREPVSRETIERVLTAATWAPSAHNRQPWRFCVVGPGATREAFVAALSATWRADLASDGLDDDTIALRIEISRTRMLEAAVLIVASLCMEQMDDYPDARRREAERTMGVQSVALACQNLLLAAHADGLGACWMCAPLFAQQTVQQALDLPSDWEPQALITLGYPAEVKSRKRAPLESRVVWR